MPIRGESLTIRKKHDPLKSYTENDLLHEKKLHDSILIPFISRRDHDIFQKAQTFNIKLISTVSYT